MTIQDIEKLAELARIEMPESEKQEFLDNMESTLRYVGIIEKVTAEIPVPTAGEVRNVLREDTDPRASGVYTEKILAQAPATQDGFVKVKQIL